MIFFCSYFLVESLLPLKILFRLYMLRMSNSENIIIVKKILMDNLVILPQLYYKAMSFKDNK